MVCELALRALSTSDISLTVPERERQTLIHPVIDTGVVVGELLIPMRNAKLVEPPHEPSGTIQ
jgi:hypothetical protein